MTDTTNTETVTTAKTVTKDPVYGRGIRMMLVELTSNTNNVQVGNSGVCWPAGTSRGLILESDEPLYLAQTMTPQNLADLEFAKAQNARDFEAYLSAPLQRMKDDGIGEDEKEFRDRERELRAKYSGSAQAIHRRLYGADEKPFTSFRVVERDLANPSDQRRADTEAASQAPLAASISAAVRDAMSAQNVDNAAAIATAVALALKEVFAQSGGKK